MESKFGEKLIVTVSGGSHEPSVSVSIKGLPQDFPYDMKKLQAFLDRRAPGRSSLTSSRKEDDIPLRLDDGSSSEMIFEIRNSDAHRSDYESIHNIPRPGHADYTARLRYGNAVDMSGGGPFSGRMTAPLCIAGGLALQVLEKRGISISARLVSAGGSTDIEAAIKAAIGEEDSVGGLVECIASGVPGGIGSAMYGGLESRLSPILFGIPAVKGVEFGAGFEAASMKGSENNDPFYCDEEPADGQLPHLKTRTNNCGGILGGITNGMPVICRVAFKPTPSIGIPQESVDLVTGESAELVVTGRHDPCVAVRAIPVVEAAMALGLLDAMLCAESDSSCEADELMQLRREIDETDEALLNLLKQRMNITERISLVKRNSGMDICDPEREAAKLEYVSENIAPAFAPYAAELFKGLFAMSRDYQAALADSRGYGLIGHPLSHSFSKTVHESIGEYGFSLFDLEPEEMRAFINSRRFSGLTVTKPYKQDVIPMCDKLTSLAKETGAVNTLFFHNGWLIGHNTDYHGFLYTAQRSNIDLKDRIILILGTGATSRTVQKACSDKGASLILFATRGESDGHRVFNYENLQAVSSQIEIIINATPVGTYPDNLESLINLKDFPMCQAVIDVVYNPYRTDLILQAQALGLKTANGLPMIVAQAMAAAGRFLSKPGMFLEQTEPILQKLEAEMGNIVLIGMPGCGKTTAGRKLADASGRKFVDLDEEIEKETGLPVPELINKYGEAFFRRTESFVARRAGAEHGQIIATGGGIVLRDENYNFLKQNGTIIWLKRPVDQLETEGRPLSKDRETLKKMAAERYSLYSQWADNIINSDELI